MPNPWWQISGALRPCDCRSISPANYELHALKCRDINVEPWTLTCLPGNMCFEGSDLGEQSIHLIPTLHWFLMGRWSSSTWMDLLKYLAVLFCALLLCPPIEIQCNFVAFKWYASTIMVMERLCDCYWRKGSGSLYLELRFESTHDGNLVAVENLRYIFKKRGSQTSEQTFSKICWFGTDFGFVTSFSSHVLQPWFLFESSFQGMQTGPHWWCLDPCLCSVHS